MFSVSDSHEHNVYKVFSSVFAACACDLQGSQSVFCDQPTGQCVCVLGASGRQCDRCLPGHWGFPSCRACSCNGHTGDCSPDTGGCIGCRGHSTGHTCDRRVTPLHQVLLNATGPNHHPPIHTRMGGATMMGGASMQGAACPSGLTEIHTTVTHIHTPQKQHAGAIWGSEFCPRTL